MKMQASHSIQCLDSRPRSDRKQIYLRATTEVSNLVTAPPFIVILASKNDFNATCKI